MSEKAKKELILEGLCCANCAAKIEREANKISGVDKATVDFVSKKLIVSLNNKDDSVRVIKEATEIVKKIEPDVEVINREEGKAENSHNHEHSDEGYKDEIFKIAISLIIFFGTLYFKFPHKIEFILFLISYLIVGGEVLSRALKNILRGQVFDENFLMSIATIGAFAIGEFPEGVAVMLFYQIGELFQDMAVEKSRKSISELMDIRPDYANLKVNNEIKRVNPEEIKVGDVIVIRPGEKIPLDGKVLEGKSTLDTSALTGESMPREVEAGKQVLSGFINKNGLLTVEVEKVFKDSTVAKILDLVENASSRKAPTENFITKFARFYTPAVVITALVLAILPPLFINGAGFSEWIYRALVFLVVSCPCALVVSIPLGFFGGIGGASKNGILVKGGNYLEALNQVETVIFDKTGTLTKGVFKVTEIQPVEEIPKEALLEYAAYAEAYSNHPIGASILEAYGKEINRSEVRGYNEISGKGIKVKVKEKEIIAGNAKLLEAENIYFDTVEVSGTIVYIAVDKKYCGYVVISDEIKEDSKSAIDILKKMGIKKIVMLTGDSKLAAEAVGKSLGIQEVYSELLPGEKVEKLEIIDKAKPNKAKLIFVGDGINDAPVLARADIGIAMGGIGSDAAIEAADVVIMTDEPSKIAAAIRIARGTRSIVSQNIVFALGVKAIVLLLGAIGLANMWEAVFADVGVALIAILNSMRALRVN